MPEEKALIIDEWEDNHDNNRLHLEPCYKEIRNGIVEPEEVVVFSQYFLKRWGPRLGPTLALLVIRLRMYCYYNRRTKEKRNWCFPSQETLAKDLGVSKKTIERELKREIARKFIKREPRYVYNEMLSKKVRTTDMYYIAMDDPLIPEDEALLIQRLKEKQLRQKKGGNIPMEGIPDSTNRQFVRQVEIHRKRALGPNRQIVCQVGSPMEKGSPNRQIVSHISTDKLSEKDVLLRRTENNVDVNGVEQMVSSEVESEARVRVMVQDMLDVLEDGKSKNFYILVARKVLDVHRSPQIIYRALSETKAEALAGNIKRSKGAYFTALIKRYLAEDGINLARK